MLIFRPETAIGWQRTSFCAFWRWKSRRRGGQPSVDRALIQLIRRMWELNPTWGSPRIRNELAKLGISASTSTIRKYRLQVISHLNGILLEVATEADWPWQVDLMTNLDRVLSATDQIVSSSDHAILERCQRWFNLARQVIAKHVPQARIVDLGLEEDAQAGG